MVKAKSKKAPVKKTAARKSAAKQGAVSKTTAASPEARMDAVTPDNVRNVFLAGLGFCGKAIEEAQHLWSTEVSKAERPCPS